MLVTWNMHGYMSYLYISSYACKPAVKACRHVTYVFATLPRIKDLTLMTCNLHSVERQKQGEPEVDGVTASLSLVYV